ncbi:MAG: RnfABCDGE type electron transport complex subunit D [Ruminococcaceae bacterium]|nr:RnfABCDGE type electron transport complex subunit D [Oscillospiraceae bacterium]
MKYPNLNLTLSSSPHSHSKNSTAVIMRDVCIALIPALIAAIWLFGPRALTMTVVSSASCVVFEWAYRNLMKKDQTVSDWSAVVTGMLVAFVCPVNLPMWTLVLGDFFAIVVVKQLFGGIGMNIVNPALAARAFMFSWPSLMSGNWISPLDGTTCATPMAALSEGTLPAESLLDLFLGKVGGSFGEVSALALILGGAYLLVRKVISARIPLAYLLTVAVLAFCFPVGGNARLDWMLYQLLSGGLMLGAIFMATDYTTSPVTHGGQIVFGIGCGVLTIALRYFGSYVEGVSYAILIMNCCVGFFDKIGIPKRFGLKKGGEAK